MRKGYLVKFLDWKKRKAASYIVAHAKWQKSRGRRPSEPYKHEKNPAKALALAISELKTYYPGGGEHLNYVATITMRNAHLINHGVNVTFNGVSFVVLPTDTLIDVEGKYQTGLEIQSLELQTSALARAHKKLMQVELGQSGKAVNHLMENLPDFSNLSEIMNWLAELQDPSDTVGVTVPWQEIINIFGQNGFYIGAFTGADFDENNEEIVARWIIGQALGNLKSPMHAIHQVFHTFADEWREKWDH